MPNRTPGQDFAVEYPPGPAAASAAVWPPPGMTDVRMPFTREQASRLVDGAIATGQIPPSRRDHYHSRILAGGPDGGAAVVTLLQLAPLGDVAASAGRAGDDVLYDELYPEPGRAPVPVAASAGDESLYRALYPVAAADGDRHGPVDGHGPVVAVHAHEHSDYAGGTHYHEHAHDGDAAHWPGAGHEHRLAAADPAGEMTLDEVYRRLYGPAG